MRRKINLVCLVVIAIGAILSGREAFAQHEKLVPNPQYCCAYQCYGTVCGKCCGPNGCRITSEGCSTW